MPYLRQIIQENLIHTNRNRHIILVLEQSLLKYNSYKDRVSKSAKTQLSLCKRNGNRRESDSGWHEYSII